jgi:hypothetical protein
VHVSGSGCVALAAALTCHVLLQRLTSSRWLVSCHGLSRGQKVLGYGFCCMMLSSDIVVLCMQQHGKARSTLPCSSGKEYVPCILQPGARICPLSACTLSTNQICRQGVMHTPQFWMRCGIVSHFVPGQDSLQLWHAMSGCTCKNSCKCSLTWHATIVNCPCPRTQSVTVQLCSSLGACQTQCSRHGS